MSKQAELIDTVRALAKTALRPLVEEIGHCTKG